MNERIGKLRKRFFETIPEICSERARYFTQSMKETEGEYIVIRRAKAFAHVLENMSIFVQDGELLVGNQASKPWSAPIYPEYSVDWLVQELNGDPYYLHERPADKFICAEDVKEEIIALTDYWRGKTIFENLRKRLPDECNTAWDMGVIDETWVSVAALGNMLPNYELVLTKGLNHVIEHAERRLAEIDLTEPDECKKYWFLQSVIIANKAVIRFAERFAQKCEELAETESDAARKSELLKMAENCKNVPANPAKDFWEGLQSVWFVLLMYYIEANGHSNSLGRFDQYLYPLYKKDLEEGNITRDKALELVESFIVKGNSINKLRIWAETQMMLNYHMAINLSIGGQTEDGKDAVNALSYLCIEAFEDVKLFTISLSVKWFEGTDDKFIARALKAVQEHKGGMPAFFNDKAFIKALENMGVEEKDAKNWAPVGCVEASVPGKWDFATKGPGLNIVKVLEITLNNGTDPATGITLLPGDGDMTTFSSTEEIFEAFKKQLHYFMRLQVIIEHINDTLHRDVDINAFSSSLIHDCIERGLSLIEGGSVYSADGGPTAGTITAGDCMAAVKYMVFDKKLITAEQMMHALKTNYEDMTTHPTGEEIRQMIDNRVPKFGNDDDYADEWSVKIADYIGSTYHNDFKNSRYGKGPIPATYSYSMSPVTGNVAFGTFIGATPNGRKAHSPVNNGISPSNGAERTGITAAVNSVGKMPSMWFQKGAILNMRLAGGVLTTEEGRERVAAIIKVMFENYGQQIQFNVVENSTLKDAKEHPENYRDLMVRVSGYSCLFVPLDPKCQDDLIERMEINV